MDYFILGKNIRNARKNANITQEKLAEYTDLSTAFISQIERGARKPSLETVYSISVILKILIDDLLKDVVPTKTIPNLDKIALLLKNRTPSEIDLASVLVETLMNNLEDGKVL